MPQVAPLNVVIDVNGFVVTTLDMDPVSNKDGLTAYVGGLKVENIDTQTVVKEVPTIPALQTSLTVSLHRPSKTSRISKVRLKLVEPVAALDAMGVPTAVKSHENSVDITYMFAEKSTAAERIALDAHFKALIGVNNSDLYQVVQQLKSLY